MLLSLALAWGKKQEMCLYWSPSIVVNMHWKRGGHLRAKKRGAELVKDKKEGDRDTWNCDALHSIMLMRMIIMSSPQAVEADRVGVGVGVGASVSLLTLGFVCMRVQGKGREEKPKLLKVILFRCLDIFTLCPLY